MIYWLRYLLRTILHGIVSWYHFGLQNLHKITSGFVFAYSSGFWNIPREKILSASICIDRYSKRSLITSFHVTRWTIGIRSSHDLDSGTRVSRIWNAPRRILWLSTLFHSIAVWLRVYRPHSLRAYYTRTKVKSSGHRFLLTLETHAWLTLALHSRGVVGSSFCQLLFPLDGQTIVPRSCVVLSAASQRRIVSDLTVSLINDSFPRTVYLPDTIRVFKYVDARLSSDIEQNFCSSNVNELSNIRLNGYFQGPRLLRSGGSACDRFVGNSRSHFSNIVRQRRDQRFKNSPLRSIEDKTLLRNFFRNWQFSLL